MMTRPTSRSTAVWSFNDLRRGAFYRATTSAGTTVGEYLGMETAHGDRSILIRRPTGTASILLGDVLLLRAA